MAAGEILELKAAFRRSIGEIGSLEAAARLPGVRVSFSRLAQYGNENLPADIAPLDVALALDLETGLRGGRRHHAETFARLAGGAFAAEDGAPAGPGPARALARLIADSGSLAATLVTALADGRLSANERKTIIAQADALRAALGQLEAAIRAAE